MPPCQKAIPFTDSRAMGPRLEGSRLTRVEIDHVELTTLRGGVVGSVRAVGKHLLIGVGEVSSRCI